MTNEDPSPCSLISNVLGLELAMSGKDKEVSSSSKNSYGTIENSNATENNREKKSNILKVLAIKTASLLDWNLMKFEREYV